MFIMGVDPGTAITGYGLVKYNGSRYSLVECGCIRTSPDTPMSERLHTIYRELTGIIGQYQPEQFAVEELFFNKNARTALAVGHARGVAMLAASSSGLPVFEYTPLQVKQAVTGFGRAAKEQVQYMVKTILALPEAPNPDDVADALAVAICHGQLYSWVRKLQ
ncbi:MAG: crossover junction endodeoxyribonuclease RuvC [Desulfotomaculaceae bacterium]|nr:crossover junction endodeoxyribonuclease RuvC [Desulfotomaculaceae bacterium]